MNNTHALLQRWFKKYRASTSGGVLIYIAFGLPLLLGAMALSIDLGRAFILNTELKDFSDAAALAGAAELDGRPGAMAAAEAAARTGISGSLINVQTFATDGDGPNIQVDQVVFLKNLPADGTDFTAADTATADAEARFIFVSVVNRSVTSGLSRTLGVIPDFETTAKSIAGFSSLTCRIPPIFMCNPLEADGTSDSTGDYPAFPVAGLAGCDANQDLGPGKPLKDECLTGRQMLAKNVGNGSAYTPGNFGLLDSPACSNQGANCLGEQLAILAPDFCVADTVDFRTGEAMGPIRRGINVRFDLYSQNFASKSGDPNFPPAMNVTKGYTGPDCNSSETLPPVAEKLPRDSCLADPSNCTPGSDPRFGEGDWYQETYDDDGDPTTPFVEPYWAVNHPDDDEPDTLDAPFFKNYQDMTRWEVYRHEIENLNMIPDNSPTGENGNPQCYTGSTPSPDPTYDNDDVGIDETDRRVFPMAAVNCRQLQLDGVSLSGNTNDVPTIGLIRVFITEPIKEPGGGGGGGGQQADIYVELAGVLDPGEADVYRDVVQLYR